MRRCRNSKRPTSSKGHRGTDGVPSLLPQRGAHPSSPHCIRGGLFGAEKNQETAEMPPGKTVGQGTVRRMTQFPVPLLRTNVKPARSKRVRVPL